MPAPTQDRVVERIRAVREVCVVPMPARLLRRHRFQLPPRDGCGDLFDER